MDARTHMERGSMRPAANGARALEGVEFPARLQAAIEHAAGTLLDAQDAQGYWCFELEADCTIPSEYILMMHFMDEVDAPLQAKLAVYLRGHQEGHGGWPLYSGGALDLSASVKAYYALKLAGDEVDAPHMRRAREAILTHGGAARSNVFTRFALAMFGQVPWRAVPFVPVEIMLLPRWFPFHLSKVSYWSRTVMVSLAILYSLRAQARNPLGVDVRELFVRPPEHERDYFPARSRLNRLLLWVERTARWGEGLIPRAVRRRALQRAEAWMVERLNGEGGLGAIFPAMVNAYESLALLGYPPEHPHRRTARRALRQLVVEDAEQAYCQPCVSPVWDTAIASLALVETGEAGASAAARRALCWLRGKQLLDTCGDWWSDRPHLPGGGWAFQFRNDHYPDLDDTAMVGWAMLRAQDPACAESAQRAADWLEGMQSANGGFAAFDADNTAYYLNEIPFADHGALLDPPTADVSARVLLFLALRDRTRYAAAIARCRDYLLREQEADGSWFGRWGTNYIYGTWSVLTALAEAGESPDAPAIRRAATWLKTCQRPDGGWGETNDSYAEPALAGQSDAGTAFQTAWAMLALIAAGEGASEAVRRGAHYLLARQRPDGTWDDPVFTAPGFPRVFYLKYHGYNRYFPLWALARYRALQDGWCN